jgi:hypothetical protein
MNEHEGESCLVDVGWSHLGYRYRERKSAAHHTHTLSPRLPHISASLQPATALVRLA